MGGNLKQLTLSHLHIYAFVFVRFAIAWFVNSLSTFSFIISQNQLVHNIIGCKYDIRMHFEIKGTSALRAFDFTMHGNTMLKSLSKPRTDSFPCHTACIQRNYNSILIDYFYCAADIFKVVYRMPSPSSVRRRRRLAARSLGRQLFSNRIGALNFIRSFRYVAWMCTTIFSQNLQIILFCCWCFWFFPMVFDYQK